MAPPTASPPVAEAIPAELRAIYQWVLWRWVQRDRKWTKPPYQANGKLADSTDSDTWVSFETALDAYERGGFDGIGFVVTMAVGIIGVDLDHCRDRGTGAIEPWAQAIVDRLASYCEVSPSGSGLRVFVHGQIPTGGRKRGDVEMYDSGRYLTVTGCNLEATPVTVEHRQAEIEGIHAEVFGDRPHQDMVAPPRPAALPGGPMADQELLQKALSAKNGESFRALWYGDASGYPSPSEGDLAMCSHLAFWTGGDPVRIDRLYRHSGLLRSKWDEKHGAQTYGAMTIAKALEGVTDVYPPDRLRTSDLGAYIAPVETTYRPSQATRLVELARQGEVELWRDHEHNPWATIPTEGHKENWPVRRTRFRRWLSQKCYLGEGKTPGAQALQDALGVLEGEAIFNGPEHQVNTRLAEHNGIIYLDLANQPWEAIEITPAGWQVVPQPPVKFRRSRGMLPLPHPVAGGSIEELHPFINVSSDPEAADGDWYLVVAWIVATLRGAGPFPLLVLHGEQGSAKSTTERVVRMLVDPNIAPLRAEPRDGRDLMIAATNSWVMALDNLSHLPHWLSDALSRLATGGGFATRELYSDADEVLFNGQRPVILNGIEELTTRGDLLDRSIVLYLPPIAEDKRRPEAKFWGEFEQARPRILAALLDGVSHGLANVGQVSLSQLPRMADFAVWTCAVAPALGFTQEKFLDAYAHNRSNAHSLTLEVSSVYGPLTTLLDAQDWEGTATQLLVELEAVVDEKTRRLKGWPGNGGTLSNALRRLAPNLRAIGIEVTFATPHGKRLISLQGEGLRSLRSSVPPPTTDGGSGTQTVPGGTGNNPPVEPFQIRWNAGNVRNANTPIYSQHNGEPEAVVPSPGGWPFRQGRG